MAKKQTVEGVEQLMVVAQSLYQSARKALKFSEMAISEEEALHPAYAVMLGVIEHHLNKVTIQWHKNSAKQGWENKKAEIVLSWQHIFLPIPVSILERSGLLKKVKEKMSIKFTGFRLISLQYSGRICGAPVNLNEGDWVPYVDEGYQGGFYWARPEATAEVFEEEEHITSLVAIGYDEVEKKLGLNLREIMSRVPDGHSEGWYFDEYYRIPYWNLG